jgi:hypothetical protein
MLRQLIQFPSVCIPMLAAVRSASVTGGLWGGHPQVQFFFEHAPWFLRLHSQPTRGGAGFRPRMARPFSFGYRLLASRRIFVT